MTLSTVDGARELRLCETTLIKFVNNIKFYKVQTDYNSSTTKFTAHADSRRRELIFVVGGSVRAYAYAKIEHVKIRAYFSKNRIRV